MSVRSLLERVTAPGAITTVFQPIFEVRGSRCRIHAIECLSRGPRGTRFASPEALFRYTRRRNAECVVDRACVRAALAAAAEVAEAGGERLSFTLNVHASTLGRDPDFVAFLIDEAERSAIAPERLTVEIVEHTPSWDEAAFACSLEDLRRHGLRLALDDVGLGYCNYKMLIDCRPDYFKVDRYISHGSGDDYYRQAVLESIAQLAERFGALVVSEGVEQKRDLESILTLGIDLIQGYLLSPPVSAEELIASGLLGEDRLEVDGLGGEPGEASLDGTWA